MYDRQFIIAPSKFIDNLNWKKKELINGLELKTHELLEVSQENLNGDRIILLGYILDPFNPELSNKQIIKNLLKNTDGVDTLCNLLYKLSGRFIIIYINNDMMYLIHDLQGLRSIYWAHANDSYFICASQPSHIAEIMDFRFSNYAIENFIKTDYYKNNKESWLPGPFTLYKEITQVLPNHFLHYNKNKQIRYWPKESKKRNNLELVVNESVEIFKNTIKALENRYELAIPITSGYDSRLVLAATMDNPDKHFYYTCLYGNLDSNSSDVDIPKKMLNEMGIVHNVIDCNGYMSSEYKDYYKINCYLSHEYYGDIGYVLKKKYPSDKIDIRAMSEPFRFFYFNKIANNGCDLANIAKMGGGEFAIASLEKWFQESHPIIKEYNYDLLDIFYLEHRLGSWRSLSALEWDGIRELSDPFNCRYLLDLMLSVDEKHRMGNPELLRMMIKKMSPDLLEFPINPKQGLNKVKYSLVNFIINIGLFKPISRLYKIIKK